MTCFEQKKEPFFSAKLQSMSVNVSMVRTAAKNYSFSFKDVGNVAKCYSLRMSENLCYTNKNVNGESKKY